MSASTYRHDTPRVTEVSLQARQRLERSASTGPDRAAALRAAFDRAAAAAADAAGGGGGAGGVDGGTGGGLRGEAVGKALVHRVSVVFAGVHAALAEVWEGVVGAWAGLETEWMLVLEHESRQIHRQRLARGTLSETVESGVHADSAERMCAHEALVLCVTPLLLPPYQCMCLVLRGCARTGRLCVRLRDGR